MIKRVVFVSGICMMTGLLLAVNVHAADPPSNEELYQMILELKENQERLKTEADVARAEAEKAKHELDVTRRVLDATREKLKDAEEEILQTQEVIAKTREGLAETQAELGTGPSSSVVKIPDKPGGWTAMAEVMFMRPSTGEFGYVISEGAPQSGKVVGPARVLSVDNDYGPGFRVGASHDFAGTGVDMKLTYSNLRTSFSDAAVAPPGGALFAILDNRKRDASSVRGGEADTASANFVFDFDVVDLEVGQTFQAGGSSVDIRLFGGIRYVNIDQGMKVRYGGRDFSGGGSNFTDIKSDVDFWGIGPRIGVGGSWTLGYGFSLFADTAGSLLVADFDASLIDTRNNPSITLVQHFETRVVPVAEISLGAGWMHQFSWGLFTLQGGYQLENYFNVVDPLRLSQGSENDPGLDASNTTDLSLDGFFFRGDVRF